MGFENGKLVRVVLRAQAGVRAQQVNVFHYDLITGLATEPNDPQTLADVFRDSVRPAFQALYSAQWQLDPVIVTEEKDPQNPNAGRQQWQSGNPIPGSRTVGTSDELAPALCGVATLKTTNVGRRHTGRIFLGGTIFEANIVASIWDPAQVALWQTYVDTIPHQPDLSTGADPGTVAHWCVYSRTQRLGDFDPYASKITSVIVHPKVHWLRSRDDG